MLTGAPLNVVRLPVVGTAAIRVPIVLKTVLLKPNTKTVLKTIFNVYSLIDGAVTPALLSFTFSPFLDAAKVPKTLGTV